MNQVRSVALFCSFLFFFLAGCSSTQSSAQLLAEDSYIVYLETYKAYAEAEERYMNVLFNLERMPEEEDLWIMKRSLTAELEQLRTLMLQSRAEFEDAVKAWDEHLQNNLAEIKKGKNFVSPNLRGAEAKRSSPGELLPGEAAKIGRNAESSNRY
ncbi:MAG: hypothetical protein J6A06_07955 [Fibrobacteraceae bacterium]|nr:hypothetical protein [Fibrobacteraceae bacterium]